MCFTRCMGLPSREAYLAIISTPYKAVTIVHYFLATRQYRLLDDSIMRLLKVTTAVLRGATNELQASDVVVFNSINFEQSRGLLVQQPATGNGFQHSKSPLLARYIIGSLWDVISNERMELYAPVLGALISKVQLKKVDRFEAAKAARAVAKGKGRQAAKTLVIDDDWRIRCFPEPSSGWVQAPRAGPGT